MEKDLTPKRFTGKTKYLDIKKLEKENNILLYFGFIMGLFFIIVLEPFVTLKGYVKTINIYSIKDLENVKYIKVELVILPRTEKSISPIVKKESELLSVPHVEEKKEKEQVLNIEKNIADIVELSDSTETDTLDQQSSENKVDTILRQSIPKKKFTPYADGRSLSTRRISENDSIQTRHTIELYPSSQVTQEKHKEENISIDHIKDERRQISNDIWGIQLQGALIVLPLARHAVKSVVWKIKDIKHNQKKENVRNSNFIEINEKDLRFMILIWRDGLIDPNKLSLQDRIFINESKSRIIQTNFSYLEEMETRGLVSSVMIEGNILFKSNFSRMEILQTYIAVYGTMNESIEKDIILEYIELIARCYDIYKNQVTIFEYP